MRAFSILLRLLGLSYRGVQDALAGLGVVLKKSQICDNVQTVGEKQIGLNIKERYRPMRGYKSETSLRRVVTLTAYLRDAHDPQALIEALAA